MKPIVCTESIAENVFIESQPIARGLAEVYRGALVSNMGSPAQESSPYRKSAFVSTTVPVIVRILPNDSAQLAIHRSLFQRVTHSRLRLSNTPAPRLLLKLGNGRDVLASVEEYVTGARVTNLLKTLLDQSSPMPYSIAITLGAQLLTLWQTALPSAIYQSPELKDTFVDATGRLRVIPTYHEERSRHIVGAALLSLHDMLSLMSPEEVVGSPSNTQSAMFHLGTLLYHLLTGHHPVIEDRRELFHAMARIVEIDAKPLRTFRPDVHPVLSAFVHRCLSRDPQQRFSDWNHLFAAYAGVQALVPHADADDVRALVMQMLPLDTWEDAPPVEMSSLLESDILFTHSYVPAPRFQSMPLENEDTTLIRQAKPWSQPVLDIDTVYPKADARPMYRVNESLFVDARPVTRAEIARFLWATRSATQPQLRSWNSSDDDDACVSVSHELADAYAKWAGKRLPTETEWEAAVGLLGPDKLAACHVWEWTATPHEQEGYVVRGGRWRDQLDRDAQPENRSFSTRSAPDIGFRCVASD